MIGAGFALSMDDSHTGVARSAARMLNAPSGAGASAARGAGSTTQITNYFQISGADNPKAVARKVLETLMMQMGQVRQMQVGMEDYVAGVAMGVPSLALPSVCQSCRNAEKSVQAAMAFSRAAALAFALVVSASLYKFVGKTPALAAVIEICCSNPSRAISVRCQCRAHAGGVMAFTARRSGRG